MVTSINKNVPKYDGVYGAFFDFVVICNLNKRKRERNMIIIKEGGEGFYEEKKSRFLAKVFIADSEEQVIKYLESIRKKYWDARHNCYAYVLGEHNEITRCSDDGEPAGTAGKPILEVLLGTGVHNCLIVVTRYFGGTLLGTGGLVRAYTQAAKDAVNNSLLAELVPGVKYFITTDYNGAGKIQYTLSGKGVQIINTEYAENVKFEVALPKEKEQEFRTLITATTNRKAPLITDRETMIEKEI